MVKLWKDAPRAEESDRAELLKFYDEFGKIEDEITGEEEEDPSWSDVLLSSFKLLPSLRKRNVKGKKKVMRQLFGRIVESGSNEPDEENDSFSASA